ncbi:MAG TPA: 2-C-methyl-D-erythritol 4-phosphate cytidylyltransferase [Solirubrobacterales bacterium]|nr:2-C-methyl-D-erythritol 4-phosphate cytidylyltransferase [Solirubrobacterales bacterium]
MSDARATAVIAAAGSGQRLGAGGPKAFADLAGRALIEWSLAALDAARSIDAIVIAAPPGHEREAELAAGRAAPRAAVAVITGGATRADSIELALDRVNGELVAIHDAARPLITADLVDRVVGRLAADPDADAAIAASPLADTVKRARAPRGESGRDAALVERTLDRDLLWAAQTPQACRANRLRAAQQRAIEGGWLAEATDEASLIECDGGLVLLEEAGEANLKVTTGADLATAATLIAARS